MVPLDHGGGQVVSVLSSLSNDMSSNTAVKSVVDKNENKLFVYVDGPLKK